MRTRFAGGRLEVMRRVPLERLGFLGRGVYLGPYYQLLVTDTSQTSGGTLPGDPLPPNLDITSSGLGLHLQRDTRDDTFYPTDGTLFDLEASFYGQGIGSDLSYQTYETTLRGYRELWEASVFAWRVLGRFRGGDAPFYDLSSYDLRGYEQGRYRDNMMLAGEVELRQWIWWRFGGVVFASLGQVAPAIDEFKSDALLWSAGFGVRFQLTEENRLNYRTDLAWGRNGFQFYFSLSEAF